MKVEEKQNIAKTIATEETVPKGYKRTEVGVIPGDWEVKTLGEISLNFINGGTPSTKVPDYWTGRIPWITGADIVGQQVAEIRRNITHEAVRNSSTNIVEAGNLLVATRTGIGKLAIAEFDLAISQDLTGVYLDERRAFTKFVFYVLDYKVDVLKKLIQGTSIPGITREVLKTVQLSLPPLPEQRAIAEALSDVDRLLESLDKLIAKKKAIKQAAMQQLLTGKVRLPGFSGEWIVWKLGEIAKIKTGDKNNEDKSNDGQYPFFVRSETVEWINTFSYDCEAILVPGEGKIGEIFHYIVGRFDVHQRVYAITHFRHEVVGKYVFYYMKQYFGVWALQHTVKATVDSLRLPTFQNFELRIPKSVYEQRAIAEVLDDMNAEIQALERRREKIKQIKQGMMQQLLTGRIRLL